ncbi:hypothetical protein GCM10018781_06660 [Kitasatospora indigofera]|uniref:Uncharacterized protein n=1 Tax=Kitasatospora indigofera TaxID=67307 RepID=A0A919KKG9_9ACTN|nr:hypothetical protein [Kitasatospora indigofera]GHH61007.1 hypothetical protein GCM10018781_06660 [Kitasatospora indigofera]
MSGLGEDGRNEDRSDGAGPAGPGRVRAGLRGRRARWVAAGAVAVALLLTGGAAWALAGQESPAAPAAARPSASTAPPQATPSGPPSGTAPGAPSATPSGAPSASPSATPAVTPPAGPPSGPGPAAAPAATRPAAAPAVTRSPSPKGGATTRRPDPTTVSPQPCGTTCGTGHAVENPDCVRSPATGQILTCDKVQTGTPLPRPSASAATPGNLPG